MIRKNYLYFKFCINETKQIPLFLLLFFTLIIEPGCKKEYSYSSANGFSVLPFDAEQVTADVSGIVLNESNQPIPDVSVKCGGKVMQTDRLGIFYFKGVTISKTNGFVSVEKQGYFTRIKSFVTADKGDNYIKVQLLKKGTGISINATTGGTVTVNGGATIFFPANAFSTSSGSAYNGNAKITARWIDPVANNLSLIMPGDLRGIDTAGKEVSLITYGMIGADLEDDNGNKLQLSSGIEATITLPLPSSIVSSAPSTIPMWHFNETYGRWMQEGSGIKAGNTYTAKVKKFSFWNCDIPFPTVKLSFTAVSTNNLLPLQQMKIRMTATNGNMTFIEEEYLNFLGYICGKVPANFQIKLEFFNSCGTVVHTQNIAPLVSNTDLGTINVNPGLSVLVTGNILNCSNAALTSGYLGFSSDSLGTYIMPVKPGGNIEFAIPVCNIPTNTSYSYQAIDLSSQQLSALDFGVCTGSTISIGIIKACGYTATSGVYIGGRATINGILSPVIWKDGTIQDLGNGVVNGQVSSVFVSGNDVYAAGQIFPDSTNFSIHKAALWKNGVLEILPNGGTQSRVYSICVDINNNVYAAGEQSVMGPALWKNSVLLNYNNQYSLGSYFSVTTNGADVYVAGQQIMGSGITLNGYWKNGVFTNIPGCFSANGIEVSGSDVYVGGRTFVNGYDAIASVWKNTNLLWSSPPGYNLSVRDIGVSGTDVYLAGSINEPNNFSSRKGTSWKNSIPITLTQGVIGDVNSIYVKGSDVYYCGLDRMGNTAIATVKYWKNNIPVVISNQDIHPEVNSIFVK